MRIRRAEPIASVGKTSKAVSPSDRRIWNRRANHGGDTARAGFNTVKKWLRSGQRT